MADQFGYRTPAILGGLLAALGLLLASFANSIIMLLISIGFITGKGHHVIEYDSYFLFLYDDSKSLYSLEDELRFLTDLPDSVILFNDP